MSINWLLKKEGLENIQKLDTMHINQIASNIAEKLYKSFPDLHLSQSDLFIQISRLNMYTAKMQDSSSSAKYVYGNNSIYFNENLDLNNINILAIHECLHYLQEIKDQKGKLVKLGLYNLTTSTGLAINEAAVQLMSTRTETPKCDSVKYYGLSFISESPEFYPLECALLSQMLFFTGDDSLYFSTLYGTSMFEKTFTEASDINTYYNIQMAFDKLLDIETDLALLTQKLENSYSSAEKSKFLRYQIESKKKSITHLVEKIQEQIIKTCFEKKLDEINTYDDIREFENDLKDFKSLLIQPDDYSFYNEFCEKISLDINSKKEQIIKYGKVLENKKRYEEFLPIETTISKVSKLQKIITSLKEFIFGNAF